MKISVFWLAAVLAAAGAVPSAHAAQAARVQFVSGEVLITGPDQIARAANKGDVLNEGDTIVTGRKSAAQLRMADEGVIAMRPDSRIVIDTFRWEGREDGRERSVLSLFKGGFRAITGVIGRRNKGNYLVNTPTATIGIRGTDHEPFYVPPPAQGETPPAPPGTYNKVNVGETVIRTQAGTVVLGANQVGYAPVQAGTPPVKLDRVPEFMRAAPIPQGRPDNRTMRDTPGGDGRREGGPRGGEGQQGNRPHHQQPPPPPAIPILTAGGGFDLGAQIANLQPAPFGAASVGGSVFPVNGQLKVGSGAILVNGAPNSFILLDAGNNPVLVSEHSGFRYARQIAPMVDAGGAVVDTVPVRWGVYAGGVQFDPVQGAINAQFFHFMGVPSVTPPATLLLGGSATYSTIQGFTKPVDEQGRIGGTVTGMSVSITFGANPQLTAYSVNVTDAGARNWGGTLGTPQSLSSFGKAQTTPNLNVTCAGACPGLGTGDAAGFVIGPTRGGVITSYSLKAGTAGVTGSVLVK
jgi:hypothetical protein